MRKKAFSTDNMKNVSRHSRAMQRHSVKYENFTATWKISREISLEWNQLISRKFFEKEKKETNR